MVHWQPLPMACSGNTLASSMALMRLTTCMHGEGWVRHACEPCMQEKALQA